MTTGRLLAIAWSPDPSVIGGTAALVVAYALWLRTRPGLRSMVFLAGIVVLLGALVSPIDRIGELYLFSVHMVQHMLLLLVVPPLLIWGLPPRATRDLLKSPLVSRVESALGRPAVALPVMVVTLWAWHIPSLYQAALLNDGIHALEHLLFLVTATMFWWPVLTPVKHRRLSPPHAMMYLFGAMASISILGIILTFAPAPLYHFYVRPPDPYRALALIRNGWGVSVLGDQQIGGVLMWIVGGIFYILAILTEFGLWFSGPDIDAPSATRGSGPPTIAEPTPVPAARSDAGAAGARDPTTAATLPHTSPPETPRASRPHRWTLINALEGAG
jgi:cytochrome c oxidase assembly factor CtaG